MPNQAPTIEIPKRRTQKRVIRIASSRKGYGGDIYERYVDQALDKWCDYSVVSFAFRLNGLFRILEFPAYLRFLRRMSDNQGHFLIRNFTGVFFPMRYPDRGVTIIHHVDPVGSSPVSWLVQQVIAAVFWLTSNKDGPIVVVSEYWRRFFESRGYRNVVLIHGSFELDRYEVPDSDVDSFRRRQGFEGHNVVYVGNPQEKKGARIVIEELRGAPLVLVTSGEGRPLAGARHLKLSFHDYLCLLRSCRVVVTFSRFREGWCRVAHEALLMGTPVIGSGRGGMSELLTGAGQVVVVDRRDIRAKVMAIVEERQVPTINFDYVRQFTQCRFAESWRELLASALVGNRPECHGPLETGARFEEHQSGVK